MVNEMCIRDSNDTDVSMTFDIKMLYDVKATVADDVKNMTETNTCLLYTSLHVGLGQGAAFGGQDEVIPQARFFQRLADPFLADRVGCLLYTSRCV